MYEDGPRAERIKNILLFYILLSRAYPFRIIWKKVPPPIFLPRCVSFFWYQTNRQTDILLTEKKSHYIYLS